MATLATLMAEPPAFCDFLQFLNKNNAIWGRLKLKVLPKPLFCRTNSYNSWQSYS